MRSLRAVQLSLALGLLTALLLQLVALPELFNIPRPYWVPLILSYWALSEPRASTLVGGFLAGLGLDVLFGSPLGQHALATVIVIYLIHRLRPIFVLLDVWQAALALIPLWALHGFLLFWVDGVAGRETDSWLRWGPVLSTTLLWMPVYILLVRLHRVRRED